jgi:hypothetical protein
MGKKKNSRQKAWGTNFWILNQTWTKAFMTSHIIGWTVAFAQTFWIIQEVRKAGRNRRL